MNPDRRILDATDPADNAEIVAWGKTHDACFVMCDKSLTGMTAYFSENTIYVSQQLYIHEVAALAHMGVDIDECRRLGQQRN